MYCLLRVEKKIGSKASQVLRFTVVRARVVIKAVEDGVSSRQIMDTYARSSHRTIYPLSPLNLPSFQHQNVNSGSGKWREKWLLWFSTAVIQRCNSAKI